MDPRSPSATTAPTIDLGSPDDDPMLSIDGMEGSALRITMTGIHVCPPPSVGADAGRFWPYADLADVRIAEYGAIGVVRATLQRDRTELPLLLLEPEAIAAARRTLEIVWNRLTVRSAGRTAA
jgi:hypothetical protein